MKKILLTVAAVLATILLSPGAYAQDLPEVPYMGEPIDTQQQNPAQMQGSQDLDSESPERTTGFVQSFRSFGTWKGAIQDIAAGTIISEESVKALGTDSFFYVEEISDRTFARMRGKSFKEYCTVPREDLRYIRCLHKDIDGNTKVGELVMHKEVADTVCGIFRQLYDASFPIESMILVDEFDASDEDSIMVNNTSAFNFRMVDNTDQISQHAYGLAIDINPYYNVYYIASENYIFPPEGWEYLDRQAHFPYKVEPGDLCYELFTEAGFVWGGWWTYNTDYQHFQYPLDITY